MIKAIIFDLQGTLMNDAKELFPEVLFYLCELKKNCSLALVSEGREIDNIENLLEDLKIKAYFKSILHCKGTPLMKKDGSAFKYIADKLNISPQEMLVVGDNLSTDIAGAKKAMGITVRIRRGKYFFLEPVNVQQIPHEEIYSLTEILEIIKKYL